VKSARRWLDPFDDMSDEDFDAHVDELFAEYQPKGVLHPVSAAGVVDTDFGTREFATLDLDGNLLTFFEWRDA